jgi:hypothetical protein
MTSAADSAIRLLPPMPHDEKEPGVPLLTRRPNTPAVIPAQAGTQGSFSNVRTSVISHPRHDDGCAAPPDLAQILILPDQGSLAGGAHERGWSAGHARAYARSR